MTTTTISSIINTGVTLGSDAFTNTSTLIVTNEAGIEINTSNDFGTYAIFTPLNLGDISIINEGIISNDWGGVLLQNASDSFTNTGSITSSSVPAVRLNGGVVTNSGYINFSGEVGYGVSIEKGFLTNTGRISGVFGAVASSAGSTLDNNGTLTGQDISAYILRGATLINSGVLGTASDGDVAGILLGAGYVNNSGTIIGDYGIRFGNTDEIISATVVTSGLIDGTSGYAIDAYGQLLLEVLPGASFNGSVTNSDEDTTLVLGGNTAGSLNMRGQMSGFDSIAFGAGASWTLEATLSDLTGSPAISGFGLGDTIVLDGFAATSHSVGAGGLTLSNDATSETLDIAGAVQFNVTDNANGGTDITTGVACFCRGTRIATPRGNIPVEKLEIGDLVKTMGGDKPIRWIGRRAYTGRFIAGDHLALPVKIRRHALGFNVPTRDLYLSPGHALAEGGVLVHAWRFINGVSITQPEFVELVEYFHIELENHDVIFAENTPVESYLDNGCRAQFQNASSARPILSQVLCLPAVEDGYYLKRLQECINARAGIKPDSAGVGPLRGHIDQAGPVLCGWAQDVTTPEVPVELELLFGGRIVHRFLANKFRADLRAAGLGSGCHAFEFRLASLHGAFTIRRASDGAIVGTTHQKAA